MHIIDADELKKRAIKVCFADVPECGARMVNANESI